MDTQDGGMSERARLTYQERIREEDEDLAKARWRSWLTVAVMVAFFYAWAIPLYFFAPGIR